VPLRLHLSLGGQLPVDEPARSVVAAPPAASWPFVYPLALDLPDTPAAILVPDIHEAFVNHQTAGTRLVTTQATYLMLAWMEAVGTHDVIMLATADRDSLAAHAPEILDRRGIFAEIVGDSPAEGSDPENDTYSSVTPLPAAEALAAAMRVAEPRERLRLCVQALDAERTPATLLAAASVCMEVNDLDAAARDLGEALHQAPDWPAAHFERGKLWLRLDDMSRASTSFRAAAERMPRFGSAWSNLGATLGELDRSAEALDAFTHALECDPNSAQTLNNIGVLQREMGQLPASEASFRRVIALEPNLAFGSYNLGHTLFLQGRYQEALGSYAQGQKRDAERNPVQAARLAMCRLAVGDGGGALTELQRAVGPLAGAYRHQLLADTHTIVWALLTHRPDLPGWQAVNEWLTQELARSAGRL
jgi:tetratricopeptide (TPR) repeat protein